MWTVVIEKGRIYTYNSCFEISEKVKEINSKPTREKDLGTLQKTCKRKVCKR